MSGELLVSEGDHLGVLFVGILFEELDCRLPCGEGPVRSIAMPRVFTVSRRRSIVLLIACSRLGARPSG